MDDLIFIVTQGEFDGKHNGFVSTDIESAIDFAMDWIQGKESEDYGRYDTFTNSIQAWNSLGKQVCECFLSGGVEMSRSELKRKLVQCIID